MKPLTRVLVFLLACGCSDANEPPAPRSVPAAAPRRAPDAKPPAATATPRRATAPAPDARDGELIALRRYESLVNGVRAATMRVRWSWAEYGGRRVVKDVTVVRSRSARMMGQVASVFSQETTITTLRTERGELLWQETLVAMGSRTDRVLLERTERGYRVTREVGANRESFEIATDTAAMVDAEAFLGPKVRAGEARPGTTFSLPLLSVPRRRLLKATLEVVGPDEEEGPGLKVIENVEGNAGLWWFAADGSVTRVRAGIRVTRRDDTVGLDDLPARPASWRITLPADVSLPRIFTGRTMRVDIDVEADETTQAPRIPPNPFTQVIQRRADRVAVLLTSHDETGATTTLPVDRKRFARFLAPTPLMEVDDPVVLRRARAIVGGEKDARRAARRIAEFVFHFLVKGSPDIGEPTAKTILRDRLGDCSEHALLFTALCRAAGIPARRCSGYVCIGSDWGAHAWCEIWVGRWIGADPTTNEIGTRARYIFLGRPDEPEVSPGRLTAERTAIRIRGVEYDDGTLDLDGDGELDLEVFSGLRLGALPPAWTVRRSRSGLTIHGGAFTATASIRPDHGYRCLDVLAERLGPDAERTTLGPRAAAVRRRGNAAYWIVPLGRQQLHLSIRGTPPPARELARLFAPTLARDDG